jgi:hypothetical protein
MKMSLCYTFIIFLGANAMNAESASSNLPASESLPGTVTLQFYNPEHFTMVQLVHDTVMGGQSNGSVKAVSQPTGLRFFGNLSLVNNGGFASAEFRLAEKLPVEPYRSIKLNVAADGRQYQLRLKTPFIPQGVAYVANFNSVIDQHSYYFQSADFTGRYRGRLFNDMPELNFADVSQISLMLADKTRGTFSIVLYSISLSPAQLL